MDIGADSLLGCIESKGSARILATSKKVACHAFLADRGGSDTRSPTSEGGGHGVHGQTMVYLTIVKQTTQKGK